MVNFIESYIITTCTQSFAFFFAEPNPPIDEVIETGVIPRLIQFLQQEENSVLQVGFLPYIS